MSKSTSLSSRLAGFNPFEKARSRREDEEDDQGEEVSAATLAAVPQTTPKSQLNVSHALRSFLVHHHVLTSTEAGLEDPTTPPQTLQHLLNDLLSQIPPALLDRSHPLPEYFISSSHNTYLMAHQLFGTSSTQAYTTVLNGGARCVEIDAWDHDEDPQEPKVTHGYTLVSHISFRSICETIRDFHDKDLAFAASNPNHHPSPILLSLENHCGVQGQQRLVDIMKETWGDRLLSKAIRETGHDEEAGEGKHVTLAELGSKICVIVEHHIPGELDPDDTDSEDEEVSFSSDSDSESPSLAKETQKAEAAKKAAPTTIIIPELAELGVYAQSVKPTNNSWYEQAALTHGPHHHLINISESGLGTHLPANTAQISMHNAHHLMRVFPKGTRISSKNLNPVPFWGLGAQICALNWQSFGGGMQMNGALFTGSDGYILKPAALRAGGDSVLSNGRMKRLRLHIAGASSIPIPTGREEDSIKPYVSAQLLHPDDLTTPHQKRKTKPYRQHKLGFMHSGENPGNADPVWDEVLEWEYVDNEMAFLRLLVKSDDSFKRNPVLGVVGLRLSYVKGGVWRFVRVLDTRGMETDSVILIKVEIKDV